MKIPVLEEKFEYKGFSCVILFMPLGFRCGYVALQKGHKYYGKEFDSIPISCHCGLTYGDYKLHTQEDKDVYWIGFDCGHCCDGFDLEKLDEYYPDSIENKIMREYHKSVNRDCEFRTLDYVKSECMDIVNQLLAESEEQCNTK